MGRRASHDLDGLGELDVTQTTNGWPPPGRRRPQWVGPLTPASRGYCAGYER